MPSTKTTTEELILPRYTQFSLTLHLDLYNIVFCIPTKAQSFRTKCWHCTHALLYKQYNGKQNNDIIIQIAMLTIHTLRVCPSQQKYFCLDYRRIFPLSYNKCRTHVLPQLAQILPMEQNFLLLFRRDHPLDSSVEFMKVWQFDHSF